MKYQHLSRLLNIGLCILNQICIPICGRMF